ncbi:MAG: ROK family transcriptional regulator [Alphaproteobacteria bacterium]
MQQDRGSNQAGMRAYNERLVLSLVRRHGGLAKADIARSTGLSAQTVSVIMRGLEEEGLLVRGEPVKGRVGQPSVPMHLAPDGAFSIGLKIGRRSADLALVDFLGEVRLQLHVVYPYPTPEPIIAFVEDGIGELLGALPKTKRKRLAGLGVAYPFELWNWSEEVGAPRDKMELWREFDLAEALGTCTDLPIFVQNDATAACGAELIVGEGSAYIDFVYLFVGSFVGGGVVLNNSVYAGRSGNAGAFGSMPIPTEYGRAQQLIDEASIFVLENQLRALGVDPSPLWLDPNDWSGFQGLIDPWIERTGESLAHAIVAACSVIDFPAAIIDGGFPRDVRRSVVLATRRAIEGLDLQGIETPDVLEGSVGANARVIGAAALPFFARYLVNQNVLLKL